MNINAAVWAVCVCLAGQVAFAQQMISYRFEPPSIAAQSQLCDSGEQAADIAQIWANWDGQGLNGRSAAQVRRDITALRKTDARRWLPVILQMIDALAVETEAFAGKFALLAQIEALAAAGEPQKVFDLQLVAQLIEADNGHSARLSRALAGFYQDGIGVQVNLDIADAYFLRAAKSNSPDALLRLAQRALSGSAPMSWREHPETTLKRALPLLLGSMDAGVCDRAGRIARLYLAGDLLSADAELALAWYRFAAAHGDAQAAWRVAELLLRAEEVAANPASLLQHLEQAAQSGLPFAQIAFGQIFEHGALVPRDLNRALALYRAAAKSDTRAPLIRLALFLQQYEAELPDLAGEKIATLQRLARRADAPGWVYSRLGKYAVASDGRWAGGDKARQSFEAAWQKEDKDGGTHLVPYLLADRSDPKNFLRAADILGALLEIHGSASAAKKLFAAHMCQAPDSPRLQEALYWQKNLMANDPPLPEFGGSTQSAPAGVAPLDLAALQSQALAGRGSALDMWFDFLQRDGGTDAEMLKHWNALAPDVAQTSAALHRLEQNAQLDARMQAAIKALVPEIVSRFGADTAQRAIDLWMDNTARGRVVELEFLLRSLVQEGSGRALYVLLQQDKRMQSQVITEFLPALVARGDFHALLLAAPYLEKSNQTVVLDRAIAVMSCDYKSAMAVVRVAARIGDAPRLRQFLQIAAHLHREKPWAMINLADAMLHYLGQSQAHAATQLYQHALRSGSPAAGQRYFELLTDPRAVVFDLERAREMFDTARRKPENTLFLALEEVLADLPLTHAEFIAGAQNATRGEGSSL